MLVYGYVSADGRAPRLRRLSAMLREVADRSDATPPDRKVGGRVENGTGTARYVLVDDDPVGQAAIRRQLDAEPE
jgi:hypothetical protein